ncbi:Zn-ribbon domain-containing OB-fold protein [Reyranella sp.]|uniref:Zn-ribbon domain-containing OB-fold protein n=1 Tax=Reyranella sp. TaxID=1929291 RepID=UPI0037834CC5
MTTRPIATSPISDETFRNLTAAAPEIRPFWEAARRGKLLLAHCTACDRPHWFPRVVCPMCSSRDVDWREASGRGTVYSVSVARRASPPYALAYVTLDEGPTMLTNIVDCDIDGVAIGQQVKVVFKGRPDALPAPMFTPL